MIKNESSYYAKKFGIRGVRKSQISNGEVVYCIPAFCFPGSSFMYHYTNCYLIIGKEITLIDCAAPNSEKSFEEGFNVVRNFYGESIKIEDIDNIIITHAHIDHFGGLSFLKERCQHPKIFVHEMDVESVEHVNRKHMAVHEKLKQFSKQAGVPDDMHKKMISMHGEFKNYLKGCDVTDAVADGDFIINNYEIIHTPGHCSGAICIKAGDVMFLGDHILNNITPHQFPRLFMKGMGLIHYFPSLLKISSKSADVRLGLPAHNTEIDDIKGRALEIIDAHHERLADVLSLLNEPISLYDVTHRYFSEIEGKELTGYDNVLAIEEIAAHLEYLIENLNCAKITNESEVKDNGIRQFQRS